MSAIDSKEQALPALPASLQAHVDKHTLLEIIVAELKRFPSYAELRSDLSLVKHLLAVALQKCPKQPDLAQEIVSQAMMLAFQLSPTEAAQISALIGFILENGVVKRLTRWKRFKRLFFRPKAKK